MLNSKVLALNTLFFDNDLWWELIIKSLFLNYKKFTN